MRCKIPRALALGLWASLSLGAGCSKTTGPSTTPAQLSAEDAQLFEQGVDFIAKLDGLEGRWREDWDRDLQRRVAASDLVAQVVVRTLRTDTDPEQRVTHRIVVHVERVIRGKEPPSAELELAVREGALGFASVDQAVRRLPEQRFVAFIKWAQGESFAPVAYFHLSPASEQVLTETEAWVARLQETGSSRRIIVHTH
jgi:hypothetical protein